MSILLHTIALEPARWKPERVSQKLSALIPKIAGTHFKLLEIYEPHLAAENELGIRELLSEYGLTPVVLSSYIQIAPKNTTEEKFLTEKDTLVERVRRFGFQKVRLFPGSGVSPDDDASIIIVAKRIVQIARDLPDTQILLETHDNSIADRPETIVSLVNQINLPNVVLLFQPTLFKADSALRQFDLQQHLIRHVHLQNRDSNNKFTTLKEGVIPWQKILSKLDVDATIEFVPSGIVPVEKFDLETTLAETVSEGEYAASVAR